MNTIYTAFPLMVKQGPDNRRLNKSTSLFIESQQLETPPIAQEYFEPGVNVKLTRRAKPKVDFTLPSDMPSLPLGFVPTNQTPGANSEPPSIVPQRELVPADLMEVFAKIAAEQKEDVRLPTLDMGSRVIREYDQALRERKEEAKAQSMLRQGFSEPEVGHAMATVRMEEAVAEARRPARPIPVEEAIAEAMGVAVQTEAAPRTMERGVPQAEVPAARPINIRQPMGAPSGRAFLSELPSIREGLVGRPSGMSIFGVPPRLLSVQPEKVRPILKSKEMGE